MLLLAQWPHFKVRMFQINFSQGSVPDNDGGAYDAPRLPIGNETVSRHESCLETVWPPCVADVNIIFMTALRNRTGHYIFAVVSFFLLLYGRPA